MQSQKVPVSGDLHVEHGGPAVQDDKIAVDGYRPLQGDGFWMVLPWPDHSCLHLFLGILKTALYSKPHVSGTSCCPLEAQTNTLRKIPPGTGQLEGTRGH